MEIIGVIHLPRLPSTTIRSERKIEETIDQAVKEASTLEKLGYDGVILENYGDKPYMKRVSDPLTIASLAVITREVVRNTSLKVGVSVLRNSGREAYSIAVASGARFVRINSLVETLITDSGFIEPEAPNLRDLSVNYPGIEIYGDILVKHAVSLTVLSRYSYLANTLFGNLYGGYPLSDMLRDLIQDLTERALIHKIIVTGLKTGSPPDPGLVAAVKKVSDKPVILGSGADPSNIKNYIKHIDGVIIGSYIKRDGKAGNPLDENRARIFIETVKNLLKQ
jgi:membrane complex biogenesis BtpA family protein